MRTHRMRAAVLLAVAALLGGVALPGPAHAEPAPARAADDGTLDQAAAAYRNGYPGVSAARAREAVRGERARRALYTELSGRSSTYGGAWFDPSSGVVNVAVTTEGAGLDALATGTRLGLRVKTHRVARSFAALERQADAIRNGTDALALAARGNVGIDVPGNRVLVSLPDRGARAATATRLPSGVAVSDEPPADAVEDTCTNRADCDDSIRAGLYLNGGACSVGFTARSGSTHYVLTAGHCSSGNGVSWSVGGTVFGTMQASRNSGAVDAAIIQVTRSPFTGHPGGQIFINWATGLWVPVVGSLTNMSQMVTGERICLSANISDAAGPNDCGVIGSASDSGRRGMTRVNGLDACGGESGGGWYWPADQGRFAYGIHSGSDSGCRVSGGRSWFTALPRIGTSLGVSFWIETQ